MIAIKKKPAKTRIKGKSNHEQDAYTMLCIEAEDVAIVPRISHLLKAARIYGKVFDILSGSEDPQARKLLDMRARLNKCQADSIPFEAYCVAADISTKDAFGLISKETMDQFSQVSTLLAKAAHPAVVQATVRSALTLDGMADRKMLHQHETFVPIARTSIVNVHGHQMIDARQQTANIALLPPLEDVVSRMHDRFNDLAPPRALPTPEEFDNPELESDEDDEE
jgi:hypothetical protein